MKTSHLKQIQQFLKTQIGKINIPFLKGSNSKQDFAETPKKTVDILPNLEQKIDDGNEIAFTQKPTLTRTQTIVNLPENEKKSLLSMVLNKKVDNKLEQTGKNSFIIKMPAFADGKEDPPISLAESNNSPNSTPTLNMANAVTDDAIPVPDVHLPLPMETKQPVSDIKSDQTITPAQSQTDARLEAKASVAGGDDPVKVTIVADKNENKNPATTNTAGLVGEAGPEVINGAKGTVTPLPQAQSVADAAKGAAAAGGAAGPLAMASKLPIPGMGALGGLSKLAGGGGGGGLLKLAGLIPGVGGVAAKALGAAGAVSGGGEEQTQTPQVAKPAAPAASAAPGAPGLLGGIAGAVGGLGMGLAAGAAGLAGGFVGGLAGGLGRGVGMGTGLMSMSPLGMMGKGISSLFGGDDKKKDDDEKKENSASVIVAGGNGIAPTNITNVNYSFDTYRKTAEDAFMLPNYRREYG